MKPYSYRLALKIETIVRDVTDIVCFPKRIFRISSLIKKGTYYPEKQRKSKREMWKDNFRWLCKNQELNPFYTSYGLDVSGSDQDEYIPRKAFIRMRNKGNQNSVAASSGVFNYIVALRDKYLFASYLSAVMGADSVVPTVAMIVNGKAYLMSQQKWVEISALLTENSELVYKIVDGECADGVMVVQVKDGKVFADSKEYEKNDFIKSIEGKRVLVQNIVVQHEALRKFGTRSVNTVRIVTVQGKSGNIGVLSAMLRLSVSADSFVDNRAVGGIGVGIDLETGRLMKYGFPHDAFGVKVEAHPVSDVRFEDYQLPFWKEVVELVTDAHRQFYALQSIGWDVVITEKGPVLLEGNDDWEISGPQDTSGGLKKRFEALMDS